VVEAAGGRVPVYAGSTAVTTREAIALTRLAEQAGVDAVSVLTPYFISPNEAQLFDHYRAVAESTSLPVRRQPGPHRVKLSSIWWPGCLDRRIVGQGLTATWATEYIQVVPTASRS
jgi:hypothetical protein